MKTYFELSSANLLHNLRLFSEMTGKKIMFVVKANAYGHGLREIVEITRELDSIGYYVVDSASEALVVRTLGKNLPILTIGWSDREELRELISENIETVVHSKDQWRILEETAVYSGKQARVHLKIETGTARLGMDSLEALNILNECSSDSVEVVGVYSHFANIEDTTDSRFADRQLRVFSDFLDKAGNRRLLKHFSCSASALLFPLTYFDMVRIGISAYGYWPSKLTRISYMEKFKERIELKPVLSWYSHIAQVKQLKKGASVGYGLTYKTLDSAEICVLPVGYYDGYDRRLSNIGHVLIHGEQAPIRGRICMNMTMVETTHIQDVSSGDRVLLLGDCGEESISADLLADRMGTINYEVLSRLSPLIPRRILY